MRQFLSALLLVLVFTAGSHALAAPLETRFFLWEIPEAWTVSRNPSGLWQITAPGPEPMEILVSVGYLSTTPELYLKGTAGLWKSLGTVEPLKPWLTESPSLPAAALKNQAWFLVKHSIKGEQHLATVKWVRWRGPLLVVTSFRMPLVSLDTWTPKIKALARGLKLRKPAFDEGDLTAEVDRVLTQNEDSEAALRDVEEAKLALNIARQDWEPYFASNPPQLYVLYRDYLEARFDAAFAIVHGNELGMGPDVVESRLQGVANRREELRQATGGF